VPHPGRITRREVGPTTQTNADILKGFTIYELMFELIGRVKESGGLGTASSRQLLIVGRVCIEELSKRATKKEGE
jgi:hypothetical protein